MNFVQILVRSNKRFSSEISRVLWANTRFYFPPIVASNKVNISHQPAVNSRYLLYIYCHLIILCFIPHTLTSVSNPHLTLRRHIPTVLIGSSETNQRTSICMDCFRKHGGTLAQPHLTTLTSKGGTSRIQAC
jgi:hypothetical protein